MNLNSSLSWNSLPEYFSHSLVLLEGGRAKKKKKKKANIPNGQVKVYTGSVAISAQFTYYRPFWISLFKRPDRDDITIFLLLHIFYSMKYSLLKVSNPFT